MEMGITDIFTINEIMCFMCVIPSAKHTFDLVNCCASNKKPLCRNIVVPHRNVL